MSTAIKSKEDRIETALLAANMAWWELEFPSGALAFSKNKTDMLGYNHEDFTHYTHFTDLVHPDDIDKTMKAMTDHYTGKAPLYETTYRIKAADGSYKTFYDRGCIVERTDDTFIVAGIVTNVTDTLALSVK